MISTLKKPFLGILLILLVALFSCDNDDEKIVIIQEPAPEQETEPGAIFVTVTEFGRRVSGAEVSTLPATQNVVTTSVGSIMIRDVEPGIYQVCALDPQIGTGASSANVESGKVINVTVELIRGVFDAPMISFAQPFNGATFDLGQAIEFLVNVSDSQDNPEEIALQWTSSLDGALSNTSANANGLAQLRIDNLSEGTHQIMVEGTDSDGNVGSASINIDIKRLPNAVTLDTIQADLNGFSLNWSISDEVSFVSYRIYRSEGQGFEIINIIDNIDSTSFVDNSIQFGVNYSYQIGVLIANGDESLSNIESQVFFGENIQLNAQIEDLLVDPVRPYIYGLDRVNNSLLFINKDSREVEKTIFVGSAPTDMDIDMSGDTLYIANFGSTEIAVVDLTNQSVNRSLFVNTNAGTWDGNPYRLALMAGSRLVFTSEDQWNNLKMVNTSTGILIQTTGSIYQPGLIANEDGTILFVSESGSTGSQLIRFNLENNQLVQVDQSVSRTNFGDRDAVITKDGNYIFYGGNKLLANSLQSNLGTFSENIYAANSDGSIAIGSTNIFNGETFAIVRRLPLTSTTMALDPNDETLYIYDNESSKLVIVNIN